MNVMNTSGVATTVEKNPRPTKIPLTDVKKGWTIKLDGKVYKVGSNRPLKHPTTVATQYALLFVPGSNKPVNRKYKKNLTVQVTSRS